MSEIVVSIGGHVVSIGGMLVTFPNASQAPTYAHFTDIPSPGWYQAPASMPSLPIAFIGGSSGYAQLFCFGVAVGSAVVVTNGNAATGLPQMATPGMYTIRVFADAGLTTQIGESGIVQAWAAASGPASATITIDASSIPTQPLNGAEYTLTGTVITANNYILVALGINGSAWEIFPAAVVGGIWRQTRAWGFPYRNTVIASDPSTGQSVTVTTANPIAQSGEFAPTLWYADNTYAQPVFTTASTDDSYDNGSINVSYPADWGSITAMTVAPIPALLTSPHNYGTYSFVRIRTDGLPPVPGTYTITASVSFSAHATVNLSMQPWFVPYSMPPTQAKFIANGAFADTLPAYTVIGKLSNYSVANNVRYRSQGGIFVVPPDPNAHCYDGNAIVSYSPNTPAGTYLVSVRSVEGYVTSWTYFNLTIPATTAGTISYTAPTTGITNRTAPGTSLGTATTNLTGSLTWRLRNGDSYGADRGYRVQIDQTGHITTKMYLSPCGNGVDTPGETFDIHVTNGSQSAVLSCVFIPVTFMVNITAHIGAGQTYATFNAFWNALIPNPSTPTGTFNAGSIKLFVHPGTYKDDLAVQPGTGRCYTDLWVTGVADTNGNKPLITSTEPVAFQDGKGYFNVRGTNLILEGLEIAHARANSDSGGSFHYAVCMDDSIDSTQFIGACEIRDCLLHDNDDCIGRGQAGTRTYAHHNVFAYGPDGTGYAHGLYTLGTRTDVRHNTFFGGSNGHFVKSRTDVTIVDSNNFPPLNNGTPGVIIDICNGGNAIVTNNLITMGPNSNNAHAIQYAAEIGDGDVTLALGNNLTITGNEIINIMPTAEMGLYYTAGHQQGIALSNYWNNPPAIVFGLPAVNCVVTNNQIIGFDTTYVVETGGYLNAAAPIPLGSGNTISLTAAKSNRALYIQPANWPLLNPAPGFTDTIVGPTYRPALDNGEVVGTQWLATSSGGAVVQQFPSTTPVGTILAYANTAAKSFENSDQGPYTHAIAYTDAQHTGLLALTSVGALSVASSPAGMQGQFVTIFANATSAQTGNLNPMGAAFYISPNNVNMRYARDVRNGWGVNIPFISSATATATATALAYLGTRWVRAQLVGDNSAAIIAVQSALVSQSAFDPNLKLQVLLNGYINAASTNTLTSQENIILTELYPFLAANGKSILKAIEGPNEMNNPNVGGGSRGPNDTTNKTGSAGNGVAPNATADANFVDWATQLGNWRSNVPSVEILSPTIIYFTGANYPSDLNVSGFVDYGTYHQYGTAGTGTGGVSSKLGNPGNMYNTYLHAQAGISPGKAMVMSECGVSTESGTTGYSQQGAALYQLMDLLDFFVTGGHRAMLYTLFNNSVSTQTSVTTNAQDNFGLFWPDGTPKQQAIALQNFQNLVSLNNNRNDAANLADTSYFMPVYDGSTLAVTGVTSSGDAGYVLTMPKSDGTTMIAIWREASIDTGGTFTPASPDAVHVAFGSSHSYKIWDPLGAGNVANPTAAVGAALVSSGIATSVDVTLYGAPLFIELLN